MANGNHRGIALEVDDAEWFRQVKGIDQTERIPSGYEAYTEYLYHEALNRRIPEALARADEDFPLDIGDDGACKDFAAILLQHLEDERVPKLHPREVVDVISAYIAERAILALQLDVSELDRLLVGDVRPPVSKPKLRSIPLKDAEQAAG